MIIDHYTCVDLFMLSVKNYNGDKINFPPFIEFMHEEPITNVVYILIILMKIESYWKKSSIKSKCSII